MFLLAGKNNSSSFGCIATTFSPRCFKSKTLFETWYHGIMLGLLMSHLVFGIQPIGIVGNLSGNKIFTFSVKNLQRK